MVTLLQLALSNAVAATMLALLAASAALLLRRPPLTRALWVLVLLKLVTPPMWHVNVQRPGQSIDVPRPSKTESRHARAMEILVTDDVPDLESITIEPDATRDTAPAIAVHEEPVRVSLWQSAVRYGPATIVGIWGLGTLIHLIRVAGSVAGLRKRAGRAAPVDASTLGRAQVLARRLGLRHCPRLLYVDGPISPMLCAIGTSPRLLLPAELWFRLDAGQRDTVLTHELAHLKRGDHWVRALEVLVAAIYWWHPVVWWARRALREATEQCCDAWVLWALPRSAASYATALIEAIDFISTVRPAVPALASGMGQFTDLKRRLVMIKRGTAGRALSWPMFGAVCTMGGLLLPLAPGFGQVANTTETVASSSAPQSNGNAGSVSVATSSAAETTPTATATVAVVPDGATNEVSVTSVEAVPTTPAPEVGTVTRAAGEEPRDVRDARREVERLRAQLARAQDRLARLEGRASNRAPVGIGSGLPDGTTAASQYGRAAGARASAGRGAQEQAALSRLGQAAGDNQQQRLDALEGQVREILNELRQMKREQRNNRNNDENQAK